MQGIVLGHGAEDEKKSEAGRKNNGCSNLKLSKWVYAQCSNERECSNDQKDNG